MLASLTPQLSHGDEVLLLRRDNCFAGNAGRDEGAAMAGGTHLMFMDDDDVYTENAFSLVREALVADPERVHLFRMQMPGGDLIWKDQEVREGNVGTPMMVVPNVPWKLGGWGSRYEGDYDFLTETLENRNEQPIWHEQVIALISPEA